MSGKTTVAIIAATLALTAPATFFNSPVKEEAIPDSVESQETSLPPETAPVAVFYELKLLDDQIYLFEFDSSGSELLRKPIDYIDIYSLYSSQSEVLRQGVRFDTRQAVAEFIQDLGS